MNGRIFDSAADDRVPSGKTQSETFGQQCTLEALIKS